MKINKPDIKPSREGGSLKWILIIIVAIIVASYFFDFNLQDAVEDEQTQSNFGYIKENLSDFYNAYLRNTAEYLWNDIFIDLLWENFVDNMERLKAGEPTVFEEAGQNLAVPTE